MLVAPFLRRWNYTRVLEQVRLQWHWLAAVNNMYTLSMHCHKY